MNTHETLLQIERLIQEELEIEDAKTIMFSIEHILSILASETQKDLRALMVIHNAVLDRIDELNIEE